MSWKSGSHDTCTSRSTSRRAACAIAVMLACRLPWVIRTAFGSAVDPLVSCSSAVSPSSRDGGVGVHRGAVAVERVDRAERDAALGEDRRRARRTGGPSTTSAASIILRTETVSSAQAARSVRAVGWCSIVTLPPQSHTAWASGAIATGSPASTPTAAPGASPGRPSCSARRAAAIARARSWTSAQVRRTGSRGSPVTMPCDDRDADSSNVARNRDMSAAYGPPPDPKAESPFRHGESRSRHGESRFPRTVGRRRGWARPAARVESAAVTDQPASRPDAATEADLRAAVERELPGARADLERLVRIPSIWADPAHADDTRRSAEAVAELARAAGAADVAVVDGRRRRARRHRPLARPARRPDRAALRPPRRPAHRRRRAVDVAARSSRPSATAASTPAAPPTTRRAS